MDSPLIPLAATARAVEADLAWLAALLQRRLDTYFAEKSGNPPLPGESLPPRLVPGSSPYADFVLRHDLGAAERAVMLLALAPLFTLLLQPLWLFAPPAFSLRQAGGVALITAGTLLLARSLAGGSTGGTRRTGTLVYPLLAAVLFGFSILPARWLLLENRTTPYTFFFLRAGVISLLSVLLWRPRLGWLRPPQAALTAGRAALVICQWLLMLTALQMGSPAPVKAVSETTPLFVVLLAVAFLHEKVTLPRGLGAAAVTLGIMLLV